MKKILILFFLGLAILLTFEYFKTYKSPVQLKTPLSHMIIASTAFKHNEQIPSIYTCDGKDINPPLQFSDVPAIAKSLVLIVDDPDAPMGTWVHWVLYNIDPTTRGIPEQTPPANAQEGITSSGKEGYGGPCPPSGTHRYFFKLYALDTKLTLTNSDKHAVEQAMQSHVIASAELIGLYKRK